MYQTDSILALGSNLGNKIFNLRSAVRQLNKLGAIKKIANIYISKPYGYINQNDFYNTAVLLKTSKHPLELINNIHEIEVKLRKNKSFISTQRYLYL